MIGTPASLGRAALRISLALAAAILAATLVSRLGLQPVSIVTPGAAVLVVAALFAFLPAEGLGVFLLFSLVGNTLPQVLAVDVRYFDEIGLLLLVGVAVIRYRIPNGRLQMGVGEWAIVVVAVAGVASSLGARAPAPIWVPGLFLLLKGVAFFYLASWLPLRSDAVGRVGLVMLASILLILALGAWELVTPMGFQTALGLAPYHAQRGGLVVIKSVFYHPALFGWVTVFGSLFVYAWVILRRAWSLLAVGLLLNAGTFFSGRRTPILALLLALAVALLWFAWRSRSAHAVLRTWLPFGAALTLLLGAFVPFVGGFYADTAGHYLNSPQAISAILATPPDRTQVTRIEPRTALYVGSVAIARDHFPLGAGLGRWGSYMSRRDYSPVYADYGVDLIPGLSRDNPIAIDDTFWPSVLGETGVIGLLAFVTFIGVLLVRLWRAIGPLDETAWQILALGGLMVFVQGLVASLTAGTYVAPPIAYWVFGVAGAVLATSATERDPHPQAS